MFAGPASCGDVTEAGLADAAILSTVKTGEWYYNNIILMINKYKCRVTINWIKDLRYQLKIVTSWLNKWLVFAIP